MSSHPASSQTTGLLQLPSELLRLVWDRLRHDTHAFDQAASVARVREQHALRCTCRQLRDATTPFIDTLGFSFNYEEEEQVPPMEETLQSAMCQFVAFPTAATPKALSWRYIERNDEHQAAMPELLPELFLRTRDRLGRVERVSLIGELALGYGEICSLVHACPALTDLSICRGPILGRALAPLTALLGLQSLSLDDVRPPQIDGVRASRIYAPLASLHALTKLEASWLAPEDILPHLGGLASLRELTLRDLCTPSVSNVWDAAPFRHLGGLTRLTSLYIALWEGHEDTPLDLSPSLPSSLVDLDLHRVILTAASIRRLVALPHLHRLFVSQMDPECRLSDMAYSSDALELTLYSCAAPRQLICMPLRNVACLRLGFSYRGQPANDLTWRLDAADLESTSKSLLKACQVMAPMLGGDGLRLRLDLSSPTPPSSSAPLLAALAPLARAQPPLHLHLGCNWDVSSEHVDRLAVALPTLSNLAVAEACEPNFASFAAVAGVKLPHLKSLLVGQFGASYGQTDKLPQAAQSALLALATFRATNGLPLAIHVLGGGMSPEELDRCNAVVELFRGSVGKLERGQVAFR